MLQSRLHRYIEAVAKSGSIRKASEVLNIAPSAINRQILEFERTLGLALFDRVPSGVRLTSAGEAVLSYVRRADVDHEHMLSQLRELQGLDGGRIRVVSAPGLVTALLPDLFSRFCTDHSRVELSVDVCTMHEILDAVAHCDADLGIGFDLPRDARVTTLASVSQRLGFVVKPDHPLAGQSQARLSDCISQPLLLPHSGQPLRHALDFAFSEARIEPYVMMASNSVDMRKQMVLAGAGLTVLSRVDVMGEIDAGQLVHVPIADPNLPGQTLKLVMRSRGTLEPLQAKLAEELRQSISLLSH